MSKPDAVDASVVRLIAAPALEPGVVDALQDGWQSLGRTVGISADRDLDVSALSVVLAHGDAAAALRAAGSSLRATPAEQLLWFALSSAAPEPAKEAQADGRSPDGELDRMRDALAETLSAVVRVARREVPESQWLSQRPLAIRVDGIVLRGAAGAAASGADGPHGPHVFLELDAAPLVVKAALHGVPADALRRICDAAGDERGGLAHIGASPVISARTGEPLIIVECSDARRSPLQRAFDVIDIEAARYGGRLGQATLLSHVPLPVLLETLAARMRLEIRREQIIDTHLPAR